MEQVKHRAVLVPRLSIALAAVAAPAVVAPAAQAAPRVHYFEGSALKAVGFDMLKAPSGRAPHVHRLATASFAGLAQTRSAAAPSAPTPAPAPATQPGAADAGAAIAPPAPPTTPAPATPPS